MENLYDRIDALCRRANTNITIMCKEIPISRSILSEYRAGRTKTIKSDVLSKIADYLHTTTDYLLTGEAQKEKAPINDEDLKFALWGKTDVSDKQLERIKKFARIIEDDADEDIT